MKAYATGTTEYTSWVRAVAVEIGDQTYNGVLSYTDWDGYDWDGDRIPDVSMTQSWLYDLDELTDEDTVEGVK